jgi:uncharacterized membrane protein YebE (DUF533 family)
MNIKDLDAGQLLDRIVRGSPGSADTNLGASGENSPPLLTGQARRRVASLGIGGAKAIRELAQRAWNDDEDWSGSPSGEDWGRVLLGAMLAAAKVDGRLQGNDLGSTLGREPLSDNEKAYLRAHLDRPAFLDDVARGLATRAETIEVYTASLLAIDPSRPLSRHYLEMLAARLGLERALVERVEQTVMADV